jgi:hypothetical protein
MKIKYRIAMTKAAFNNKKKNLFTSKLDLNLKKKLVKCYIDLYGAATWTVRKIDQKYLENLKCGAGYHTQCGKVISLEQNMTTLELAYKHLTRIAMLALEKA